MCPISESCDRLAIVDSWWELAESVEQEISEEINGRTRDRWSENEITDALIGRLRKVLANADLSSAREKVVIATSLYKARGAVENKFGDLAVLLAFTFRDGTSLEGVAFYEAKLRDWDGPKLPQAKKPQLERINKNLWNAKLLVYDREPIVSDNFESLRPPEWRTRLHPFFLGDDAVLVRRQRATDWVPFTHAGAVSINAALALGNYDTSLYKLSVPLSYQLCLRNMRGLDLDYDAEVVKATKGQSTKYGVPRTVLVVAVRRGPGEGPAHPPTLDDRRLELVAEQGDGRRP